MKKTIILSKGGLDAVATARNIIMELYSTLNKMAARLFTNSAAGADWQCLQKWSVDVIAAPLLWKALDFICVPFGQFSGSNQKGALIQSPPLGVFLSIQTVYFGQGISDAPQKGLSEARLPVNVYVIEYAAKLYTTNLTTKFFNENFVKKIPTF